MTWVAVAVAGGAVVGAIASNSAANKQSSATKNAANAQLQASQQSIAEQQREYNQTRADQLPFLQAGYGALTNEQKFLNGDWSGFQKSPDYKFSLDQELQGLDKSAAANGSLYSGGHSADIMQYAGGIADQFANSYWNKLAGMAGQGQVSSNTLASAGANEGNNISNLLTNAGNARASSYLRNGNIQAQNIGAMGNAFNQFLGYYANRPQTQSPTPQSFSGAGSTGSGFGNIDVSQFYGGSGGNGGFDVFGLGGRG